MRIRCPQCGKTLTIPEGAMAAQGNCPHCHSTIDLSRAQRVGVSAGDVLGDFRVGEAIGRGGMATVYRGTQISLERPVAIKVLATALARRPHFVERFQREAKVLAKLSHANIVSVLSVGSQGEIYYLVMEYVDGESLRARLDRDGPLPLGEATRIIDLVGAGLECAHAHGVLHRDIKPGNILIAADGTPKIADFGIACITGRDTSHRQRLTQAQAQMGSAHYMAPEQIKDAAAVDQRADIYGLGVLLYEALTGELPIGQFKPASRLAPGVPPAVDRLLRTALATSPDDRFATVAQFRAMLHRAALRAAPTQIQTRQAPRQQQKPSRAPYLVGAASLLVALGLAVWFAAFRGGSDEQAPATRRVATPAAARPGPAPPARRRPRGPSRKREPVPPVPDPPAPDPAAPDPAGSPGRRLSRAAVARLDRHYARTRFYTPARAAVVAFCEKHVAQLRGSHPPVGPPTDPTPAVRPPARGEPLHGALRLLPDGRVELGYDWSEPGQLRDWLPEGAAKPGLREGELQLGGADSHCVAHVAAFANDVEIAAGWRIVRREGLGDCELAICHVGGRRYVLHLADRCQYVGKSPGGRRLGESAARCADGQRHTLRFVRRGFSLKAWVNRKPLLESTDEELSGGTVALMAHNAVGAYRQVRIIGRLDPLWLDGHPAVVEQLAALKAAAGLLAVYADSLKALLPLWGKRRYAQAAATAKDLAAQKGAGVEGLVEDAQALAGFWQAAQAGAATLKPGEPFRAGGMAGKFDRLDGDTIHIKQGPVSFAKKLAELRDAELIALARRARPLTGGPDQLALALLALHSAKPDPATADAALVKAAKAGIDVSRHHALLRALGHTPTTAETAKPTTPPQPKALRFTLTVAATVDGLSDLIITPDGVFWEHRSKELPGTRPGVPKATTPTVLNGVRWFPRWSGKRTDVAPVRNLPTSFAGAGCRITKIAGRGPVSLREASATRLVIRFDDTKPGGADAYKVQIRIGPAPPFEKAIEAAFQSLDQGDGAAAKGALARAEAIERKITVPQNILDSTYAQAMDRALALAAAASFDKCRFALRIATLVRANGPDARILTKWLSTAAKPIFADDFATLSTKRWEPKLGRWRAEDGRLACSIGSQDGTLTLKAGTLKDFVLTFEVMNQDIGFRYGVQFRHTTTRHLRFCLSDQFNTVGGGSSKKQGVEVTYHRNKGRHDVKTGEFYRMTVRCIGKQVACYVNGEKFLEMTDERPVAGKIALLAHRADLRFDNFRIYRALPLPKLEFTSGR